MTAESKKCRADSRKKAYNIYSWVALWSVTGSSISVGSVPELQIDESRA